MTNLTDKFAALQELMTTQHNALLQQIAELRGPGPENTLKSLNQSIWNMVGPAPGATIVDLHALLQKIIDTFGDPSTTYPQFRTVRAILEDTYQLWNPGAGIRPYNLLDVMYMAIMANGTTETDAKAILTRLIAQFDTNVVYPTMKDLLLAISQQQAQIIANTANPLGVIPAGACAAPLTSVGSIYQDTTAALITPVTVAVWPDDPGGDFTAEYDIVHKTYARLHCSDWTKYHLYVASNADVFGVAIGDSARYPCNTWVTVYISEMPIIGGALFNTANDHDLKVYICPLDAPALGACPGSIDTLDITSWWKPGIGPGPLPNTWDARAWTGGATWTSNHSAVVGGETYDAFIITTNDATVDLCVSWDVSNDASVKEIGIHAYDLSMISDIAQAFEGIVIAERGTVGKMSLSMYFQGWDLSQIALVPYCARDAGALPPNISIKIAYLPPGWNAS